MYTIAHLCCPSFNPAAVQCDQIDRNLPNFDTFLTLCKSGISVVQLAERSLPTPENLSSNPAIRNVYKANWFTKNSSKY